MTTRPLNDSLVSAEDRTCSAWFDFVYEMEGKQYGPEETLDAWLWFKVGWSRGSEYHSLPHVSQARRAEDEAKRKASSDSLSVAKVE